MDEGRLLDIVTEVIRRLALKKAEGDKPPLDLVVVLTGASVGFLSAVQQVRVLILDGFRIHAAFSPAAEAMYGTVFRDHLKGFPHVSCIQPHQWLGSLHRCHGVVVPLLSLNTASKLSLLVADNLATNILLHGLLMGKPVVVATDGVDPEGPGRRELGFHRGNPVLRKAVSERLAILGQYGCLLTPVEKLADAVRSALKGESPSAEMGHSPANHEEVEEGLLPSHRIATAGDVLSAHRSGSKLVVSSASRMTPLARELAGRLGVTVVFP